MNAEIPFFERGPDITDPRQVLGSYRPSILQALQKVPRHLREDWAQEVITLILERVSRIRNWDESKRNGGSFTDYVWKYARDYANLRVFATQSPGPKSASTEPPESTAPLRVLDAYDEEARDVVRLIDPPTEPPMDLKRAWEGLTERERVIIFETRVNGRHLTDVAAELGLSKSGVGWLRDVATERLKEKME